MKLLIISDIHSNIGCLEAVLDHERDSDIVYCAGDLVDMGFHPREVIACVRSRGIRCIRGNHDEKVISRWREGATGDGPPPDFAAHNARQLEPEDIAFLEALPTEMSFSHDGVSYLMRHNYRGYDLIENLYTFDEFWADAPVGQGDRFRALIMGHTHHRAAMWLSEDTYWLNPGSIGYNRPSDPSIATRYITITDGRARLRELLHDQCQSRLALRDEFERRYGTASPTA